LKFFLQGSNKSVLSIHDMYDLNAIRRWYGNYWRFRWIIFMPL
jgi:hypothetical protein